MHHSHNRLRVHWPILFNNNNTFIAPRSLASLTCEESPRRMLLAGVSEKLESFERTNMRYHTYCSKSSVRTFNPHEICVFSLYSDSFLCFSRFKRKMERRKSCSFLDRKDKRTKPIAKRLKCVCSENGMDVVEAEKVPRKCARMREIVWHLDVENVENGE